MRLLAHTAVLLCAVALSSLPSFASHLVTGNGFGFAVVSPEDAGITKFYAHPYSFVRPDPKDPLSEGIETASFVKRIAWSSTVMPGSAADYVDDSHIIRMHTREANGFVFMPFGMRRATAILGWEPRAATDARGSIQVDWNHSIRSRRAVRLFGVEIQVLRFTGVEESLLLIPIGRKWPSNRATQELSSNLAWALISLENDADLEPAVREFNQWRGGLAPEALARREAAEVEQWRTKPVVHFTSEKERHLWRQSEIMLRIAQSREPNRPGRYSNGLIVAALPDGAWFTPWVRDMAWATAALMRMGHRNEARAALLAYFNARPTGKMRGETSGADYQVSVVRYFGDGSEEPFFTMEGSTNIEFDDWGEVLWILGEYLRQYDDPGLLRATTYRGPLYESARDYVLKPLLANLEPHDGGLIVAADTSIWEERQKDKKHFAFSTAAAIVGLRSFAPVARLAGDEVTQTEVQVKLASLQKGFDAAFIRGGKLHGTLEEGVKNDIDGALLPIINFNIVTDSAVVRDTVDRMELLKVASGGYRRVRCILTDPSIYEYWYEREEFLFVDFSLAELYRKIGRGAEGDAMLQRIVDKAAADHNIIPEMYVAVPCRLFPGNIGDPTGALPMVGYGAGAYVLHLIEREAARATP